jgi:hypothetical protein
VIELATAPDERAVVKRFDESFTGSSTSFLSRRAWPPTGTGWRPPRG